MTLGDALALAATTAQPPAEPLLVYQTSLERALRERSDTLAAAFTYLADHGSPLARAATTLVQGPRPGDKVLVAGNGGSAATASHIACDLAKGTRTDGVAPFRVVALTDNVPLMTAWGNDTAYERIFAEQL
ncbi:MAG TPA: SIS domain-containing protein, partial [Ktedonobacterales bacterium]|nr:SIS domain-containing protein [Ktedonobacterales bacterium]